VDLSCLVFSVRFQIFQQEEVGVPVDEGGGAWNSGGWRAVTKLNKSEKQTLTKVCGETPIENLPNYFDLCALSQS